MLLLDSEAISSMAHGPSAGSELAIDAFLVADADLRGGAVIATADMEDLQRLASVARRVRIADLDA